jgi:type IV secretory pathway VirB2 component (pilin)
MGDDKTGRVDNWFTKIQNYVTGVIGAFVAFLFLIFAAGAALTMFVMEQWPEKAFLVVLIPAAAGILAYYNRTYATIVFIGLIALVFIL